MDGSQAPAPAHATHVPCRFVVTQHRQAVQVQDPAQLAGFLELLIGTAGRWDFILGAAQVGGTAGQRQPGLAPLLSVPALPQAAPFRAAGFAEQLEEVGREVAAQASSYDEVEEAAAG